MRDAGGRLFIMGVGGSAGHASHAVDDFRKIHGLESYTPTDNVSELSAPHQRRRMGIVLFRMAERALILGSQEDAVMIFSVGRRKSREERVRPTWCAALERAQTAGSKIFGIVGKDGEDMKQVAHACVVVPVISPDRITPHTEGFCAVIWHLLVSHPALQKNAPMKWESVNEAGDSR